ncbi:MAG: RDD family protein [Candidatus Elarobacter sp.]
MERSIDVRTGESVAIRYELAGLGSRFLAVLVDLVAQIAIVFALLLAASAWMSTGGRLVARSANAGAWGIALLVLMLFTIFIGWFIIFEIWWSGRTPGKRALGLRVVRDGGFPIDSGAAVIRNLVRLIEFSLGFYAVSAICALLSKENKRLGDFAAGTIVVRDRADAVPDLDAYLSRPSRTDTGLTEGDRVLAERFLARRATLEPTARLRLAAEIAARIRPTLRASYASLDDESLLEFLTGR